MRNSFLLIVVFYLSNVAADDFFKCAKEVVTNLSVGQGMAIRSDAIAFAQDIQNEGWSILILGESSSAQCHLPEALQTCFKTNPGCHKFDFLIEVPGAKSGMQITFATDHIQLEIKHLPQGRIDSDGTIHGITKTFGNPVLGLKCSTTLTSAAKLALETRFRACTRVVTHSLPKEENAGAGR